MTMNALPVQVDGPMVQGWPSGEGPPPGSIALAQQGEVFWSVLAARSRAMLAVAEDLLPNVAARGHAIPLLAAPPERGRGDQHSDAPSDANPMAGSLPDSLLCWLPGSSSGQVVAPGSPTDVLAAETVAEAVQPVSGVANVGGVVQTAAVVVGADASPGARPLGRPSQSPGEGGVPLGTRLSDGGGEAATVVTPDRVRLGGDAQLEPESFVAHRATATPDEASSGQDRVVVADKATPPAYSSRETIASPGGDAGTVGSPAEAVRTALSRAAVETTLAPEALSVAADSEATSTTTVSDEPGQTGQMAPGTKGTKTGDQGAWTQDTSVVPAGDPPGKAGPALGGGDEWAAAGQHRPSVRSGMDLQPKPAPQGSAPSVVQEEPRAAAPGITGGAMPELMVSRLSPIAGEETLKPQAAGSGVHFEDLLPQIVRHAQLLDVDGRTEARLQLEPPSLGRLTLHVSADHNTVSIHLRADTAEARDLVQANLARLEAALQEQGIKVDRLMVHLGPALFRFGGDGQAEQQTANGFVRRSRAIEVNEGEREGWDQESLLTYWQDLRQHLVDYLA